MTISLKNKLRIKRIPKKRRKFDVMQIRIKWPSHISVLNPPRIPDIKGNAMRLHIRLGEKL